MSMPAHSITAPFAAQLAGPAIWPPARVWDMWATCNSRWEIAKYERGKVCSTGSAYWRPDVLVGVSLSGWGALKRLFAVAQRPTATTNLIPLEHHALTVFVLLRRFFHTLPPALFARTAALC